MNVECAEWILNLHSSPDFKPSLIFPISSPLSPNPACAADPSYPVFLCWIDGPALLPLWGRQAPSPPAPLTSPLAMPLPPSCHDRRPGLAWPFLIAPEWPPCLRPSRLAAPVLCSCQDSQTEAQLLPSPLETASSSSLFLSAPSFLAELLSWPVTAVTRLQPSSSISP